MGRKPSSTWQPFNAAREKARVARAKARWRSHQRRDMHRAVGKLTVRLQDQEG